MRYHLLDVLASLDMLIVDQSGPKLTKMDPSGHELTKVNLRGPNGPPYIRRRGMEDNFIFFGHPYLSYLFGNVGT